MALRALLRSMVFVSALAWGHGTGCTDPGVVGERGACEPACAGNEICNVQQRRCVTCIDDEQCSESGDGPFCQASVCVECRSSGDCGSDAGVVCVEGRCRGCTTDDECGEQHQCEDGRCVEADDSDEESEDEEGGESGDDGEAGNEG